MTEPELELESGLDHIFDSKRPVPDNRITIDINKKLILTHGLTAFDMPMVHRYTVKYFKPLKYSYNKLPILQFTKDHYQMKNGWKITLEHWWIPNVPLSERYYAHDIYVPRSSKEEHDDWTNGDWKINLLKFDYLSDDYEMQAWIDNLPEIGIPLQDVPVKKDIVEFAPPEPETNICPLCNDTIPDDTLRSPNILCEKCHRPIACPSCKGEILEPVGITECPWCHTDTESTEKIKHAIRVRKEKKTYEEEFVERAKFMTEYATAKTNQFLDFPEHGEGTPYSSMTHAMAGIKDQDQYPHRDGPNIMERKGGWGVPFDIEATPLVTPAKTGIELLKEEAQRGTGRSSQRRLSAMNHLYHRESNRLYMDRRVLFIVDNMRMVKDTMRALGELYVERFNLGSGAFETLFTKKDKIIDVFSLGGISVVGEQYTLVVLDLAFPVGKAEAKKLKMNISVYGCPIIGGESIVETGEEDTPDPDPTKYNVAEQIGFQPKDEFLGYAAGPADKDGIIGVVHNTGNTKVRLAKSNKIFKPGDLVYVDDVYPPNNPIMQQSKRIPSRKEKPPRTARPALPKKREWAKPSQSLTTTIGGTGFDWSWVIVGVPLIILFIMLIVMVVSFS